MLSCDFFSLSNFLVFLGATALFYLFLIKLVLFLNQIQTWNYSRKQWRSSETNQNLGVYQLPCCTPTPAPSPGFPWVLHSLASSSHTCSCEPSSQDLPQNSLSLLFLLHSISLFWVTCLGLFYSLVGA